MADGARYGSINFREQIEFQLGKVNVPTAGWTDVWRDEHDSAFMVAGAYKAELLADLRTAVEKGIRDGTSIEVFRRDFSKIVEKHGWSYNGGFNWRTRVIYDTNLRQSYNAGRYAQMMDPDMLAVRPFWVYHHRDGQKYPRPLHVSWNGLALPYTDAFWRAHYPSNGWGCECWVTCESRRSLERKGLSVGKAPEVKMVDRLVGKRSANPRVVQVPDGIDPGFDYAPGARRAERIRADLQRSNANLPQPIRDQAQQNLAAPAPVAPPAPVAAKPQPETLDDYIGAGREVAAQLLPTIDAGGAPQAVVLKALAKERPIGKAVDVKGRGEAARRVRAVSQMLPDEWTARSDQAGELTAKIVKNRSTYSGIGGKGDGEVRLRETGGSDIALHELMHRMQHVIPGLDSLFQQLHKRRTAGDLPELLYPDRSRETGRPDGYVERYQGREYPWGNQNGPALEVLTMAFQFALGGNPAHFEAFRQTDPEMLFLVLGTLWRYR